jgi:OmcA/MtrC family decaheme c-type cytochrome
VSWTLSKEPAVINRNAWWVLVAVALAAGCSDDDDDDNNGGGGGGPPPAPGSGAGIDVQAATFGADGTATVTFRVTDSAGVPIDFATEAQAGTTSTSFAVGQLTEIGEYVSLYLDTAQGAPFTADGASVPPAQASATQAAARSIGQAQVAQLQPQGNGVYVVTLPTPNQPFNPARTTTVAGWLSRTINNTRFGATDTLNVVPAGGTPALRQVVTDAACNRCHGVIRAHGVREGTQACLVCHTLQTTDPETANTVAFNQMVHKIHSGSSLTQPEPYRIVGFRQSVHDFSTVTLPQETQNCTTCHQGEDGEAWRTRPNVGSCTACHDYLRFNEGGLAACSLVGSRETAPCNHPGATAATANCAECHTPTGSAVAITEAHTTPRSLAGNYAWDVLEVTNSGVGQSPIVRFRAFNPATGANYTLTEPEFTAINPANGRLASSLRVHLGWMTSGEFANENTFAQRGTPPTVAPGQPARLDVIVLPTGTTTPGLSPAVTRNPDGTFTANFGALPAPSTTAAAVPVVPAGVDQIAVQIEGHPVTTQLQGEPRNVPVQNTVETFALGGAAGTPRRLATPTERCNQCHEALSAHGENRNDAITSCLVCHNPQATDLADRGGGTTTPETSIDFKFLIHAIHGSPENDTGIRRVPIEIGGTGPEAAVGPFPFPTSRKVSECTACHEGESYQLPTSQPASITVFNTTVDAGADPAILADNVRQNAAFAVCTSCHDQVQFEREDEALPSCVGPNSGPDGVVPCLHSGGAVGSTFDCSACHNPASPFSVKAVHKVP